MEEPLPADCLTCPQAQERLSDYLDGELDPPARSAVEVHLCGCPACTRFARELAATVLALHALRRGCPPRG